MGEKSEQWIFDPMT